MKRKGNCFEASFDRLLSVPTARLCHGLVRSTHFGGHIVHSWLEMGGVVFDYSNGNGGRVEYTIEEYYTLAEPRSIVRYGEREAMQEAACSGHKGPWNKLLARHHEHEMRTGKPLRDGRWLANGAK